MWSVSVQVAVISLLVLGGSPVDADAQADTVPSEGTWGLRFTLPDGGGGGLGAVRFLSDRTSLGLDVSFSYRSDASDFSSERDPVGREREATTWGAGLAPEVRSYLATDRPVVPFLKAAGRLQYHASTRDEDRRADSWTTSARTGVGAEWFPTGSVGVSGSTGIRVRYRSVEREQDDPQAESRSSGWGVDVFRSSLLLSLYF